MQLGSGNGLALVAPAGGGVTLGHLPLQIGFASKPSAGCPIRILGGFHVGRCPLYTMRECVLIRKASRGILGPLELLNLILFGLFAGAKPLSGELECESRL